MKLKLILALVASAGVMTFCTSDKGPAWQPAGNPLFTVWGENIDPSAPWPEYPRPGLVRGDWMSDSLALWYSREFTVPRNWDGKQLILNFEASDWETTVWIDDNFAISHQGGYDPFSCNITPFLSEGRKHMVVVRVTDPTDRDPQPRGKQVTAPGGIWYTPTSGIWQSVWIEPVGKSWVGDLRIISDIDNSTLTVTVMEERCHGPEGCPPVDMAPSLAEVTVKSGGEMIAVSSGMTGTPIALDIHDAQLWSPDNPHLYDLDVRTMVEEKGLRASVYTQTTDVETETNGLMTYDRKVDKMGFVNVRKAMAIQQEAIGSRQ